MKNVTKSGTEVKIHKKFQDLKKILFWIYRKRKDEKKESSNEISTNVSGWESK
jgi:hypothetical protein